MGLIKAGIGAAGGVLADSWREYFYCDSLEADVLCAKGQKRISDKGRSSNTKGESNIISDGSIIAVNEGQFMIIVEQGAIVDACGEAGRVRVRQVHRAQPVLRRVRHAGRPHQEVVRARGRAFLLRRRHGQGPARVLLQRQGDRGQQVRHGPAGAVPRGGRQHRP